MPLKMTQDDMPQINLTPMIDIVFNLIIFFMVASSFSQMEQKLDVNVPSVKSSAQSVEQPARRTVHLQRDGQIWIDQRQVTLEQLTAELTQIHHEQPNVCVIVRGDGASELQNVASVLSACRDAGVKNMSIAVKNEPLRR